jgi:hypothetical protein
MRHRELYRLLLDRELVVALDREEACVRVCASAFPDERNLLWLTSREVMPSANWRAIGRIRWSASTSWNISRTTCAALARHGGDPGAGRRRSCCWFRRSRRSTGRSTGIWATTAGIGAGRSVKLADAVGLDGRKLHYVNAVGFFGWWVNARVLKRETQSDGQIAIFDRWMVPIFSALEGAVPPPFGQSLLAVLRRPAA